jgi:hypothetical protein
LSELYEVVWPLGSRPRRESAIPSRLESLDGKTVALVWNHAFRGDDTFALFREQAGRRYPGIRFVDHEAFGNVHGANGPAEIERLPERLAAHRVDAVIVGTGG